MCSFIDAISRPAGRICCAVVVMCMGIVPAKTLAASDAPIAPLTDVVVDEVHLLDAGQHVRLRQKLLSFARERKVQFVVAIIASLGDEQVEARSLRMAETWQLGRRGVDDGLLLVIAPNDHQARFEVGYGLESVMTDVVASRLLEDARAAHPNGPDGEAVIGLATAAMGLLEAQLPPLALRRAMREPLVDPMLALALAGAAAIALLLWLTVWRRRLNAQPFRPLRPATRQNPGHAGTFRDSLWYACLLGWLSSGRRGRRGPPDGGGFGGDGGGGSPPRGQGGGFGGGGAGGRW